MCPVGGGALYASFCLGGVEIASFLKVAAQPAYLLPPAPVLAALMKNIREMPTAMRQGANFQGGLKLATGQLKWDPEHTEDCTRHMLLRCAT